MRRILLADDDVIYRERMGRSLLRLGMEVRLAGSGEEALKVAEEFEPEGAVLDLRMGGMGGMECLRELLDAHEGIRVVILTGYGSIASAIEAVRMGAVDYLTKPADGEEVLAALRGERREDGIEVKAPTLERMEWEHLQRVLHDCGGNISRAAEVLGMHRRSLQRKLQKYPPAR